MKCLLSHKGEYSAIVYDLEEIPKKKVRNHNLKPTGTTSKYIKGVCDIIIVFRFNKQCTNCMCFNLGPITVFSPVIVRISETSINSIIRIIDYIKIGFNDHAKQHIY